MFNLVYYTPGIERECLVGYKIGRAVLIELGFTGLLGDIEVFMVT